MKLKREQFGFVLSLVAKPIILMLSKEAVGKPRAKCLVFVFCIDLLM